MSADSPSSSPKPETCSRGSDGCEIKGRHDMCGTVQPKPEMLEKARDLVGRLLRMEGYNYADAEAGTDHYAPEVAVALEAVVHERDEFWRMLLDPDQRTHEYAVGSLFAQLRASEASVESLRKERNELAELIECDPGDSGPECGTCRGCLTVKLAQTRDALEAARAALLTAAKERDAEGERARGYLLSLEQSEKEIRAARAEATKAERERCAKIAESMEATDGLSLRAGGIRYTISSAIRAPRPPKPDNRPERYKNCPVCASDKITHRYAPSIVNGRATYIVWECGACYWTNDALVEPKPLTEARPSSPPPPSEEPRPRSWCKTGNPLCGLPDTDGVASFCGEACWNAAGSPERRCSDCGKPLAPWQHDGCQSVPSPEPPREEPSK